MQKNIYSKDCFLPQAGAVDNYDEETNVNKNFYLVKGVKSAVWFIKEISKQEKGENEKIKWLWTKN